MQWEQELKTLNVPKGIDSFGFKPRTLRYLVKYPKLLSYSFNPNVARPRWEIWLSPPCFHFILRRSKASGAQCRKANIIPLIFDVISTYRPHQEHCTACFTNSRSTARDGRVYSVFSPSLRDIQKVSEIGFDFVLVWQDFESLKLTAKINPLPII